MNLSFISESISDSKCCQVRVCFLKGGLAVKPSVRPALPEVECKQTRGFAKAQTETPEHMKAALNEATHTKKRGGRARSEGEKVISGREMDI